MTASAALIILMISIALFVISFIVCLIEDHWIQVKDLSYNIHKYISIKHPDPCMFLRLIKRILYAIQK